MIGKRSRRESGFASSLLFIVIIPVVLGLGVFAVDVTHLNTVRTALQDATDAAALAGAHDLYAYGGSLTSSASSISSANELSVNSALAMARLNRVDNIPVETAGSGETITASLLSISGVVPTKADPATICRVTATARVNCLYSWLTQAPQHSVGASSQAGGTHPIDTVPAGTIYPIVIGFQDLQPADSPGNAGEVSLESLKAGDTFYFEMQSNAAWSAGGSATQSLVREAQLAYGQPSLSIQSFRSGAAGGATAISVGRKASSSTEYLSACEHNYDGKGPGLSDLPNGTILLCPLVDHVGTGGELTVSGFLLLRLLGNDGNYGHVLYTTEIVRAVIPVGSATGIDLGSYAAWENKNGPLPDQLVR